ncbi:major tail protein [Mycobacterium phage PLot]|uniref:Fibronectin type-III domain-containing protein n=10 Tax=Plotvirus TaxID=2169613 RepID=Q19YC4_9CAUD|nr:major tail protein [Mycobacterium phage Troll4]YP_655220.1 major tail protein [Mycobacterium phage PBI1]YP_655404.1 major tail protein [Mycobacterium phage PLot]ACD49610.1 major tail subunit [Mycobacterium phage Adjutor]ACI06312.1 putative major tail subunit [Mycobacterium phage Butterscotch]AER49777.1 major tail subunit [Mycobacterium phage Nova]AXC38604.1 hypothetical protein SEA_VISCONTI_24 [Mycobacterium phage Visconti]AYN58166.1 major tail protein [Mycobacterium phage KandZ]QBJ04739
MAIDTALPYGLRDVKITPYADEGGTVLGDTSYDLPNAQTFSFNETEEFTELRGDDRLVATHGNGAQVDWSLEAGGISLVIWSILTGGQLIQSGLTPNRKEIMRKRGTDVRPYFRVDGQVMSESGGDIVARVYRCRCNDNIGGDFGDGTFHITSCSGVGLPLLDEANDLLYDIIRNESKTSLTLTPEPNPLQSPQNLSAGTTTATSVVLTWTEVVGADEYRVQKSSDAGVTWSLVDDVDTATITISDLTASTAYQFRVATKVGSALSVYSAPLPVTTPAST